MIEHVREVVSQVTHEQRLELVTRRRKREQQEPKPRGTEPALRTPRTHLSSSVYVSLTFSLRVPAPSSPRVPGSLLEKLPGLKGRPSGHFEGAMNWELGKLDCCPWFGLWFILHFRFLETPPPSLRSAPDMELRSQDSSLFSPFLRVSLTCLNAFPRFPTRSSEPPSTPPSDPPLPAQVGACAEGREDAFWPSLVAVVRWSAGRGGFWEKMAAAVHPRVVRVLPMSRKCHRQREPRIGNPRCGSKVLEVAPCCSGRAESWAPWFF